MRAVLLCAALAACSDKRPKMAEISEALPDLPLPPQASFVDRRGGPDALQITMRSSSTPDMVARYYRNVLKSDGWQLMNEAKDRDGATVLLAERKGPPLWVRIQEAKDGGGGTLVQLSGAVLTRTDSLPAKGDTAS